MLDCDGTESDWQNQTKNEGRKIAVRLRLRKSGIIEGNTDGVCNTLKRENKKLKQSINSISTTISQNQSVNSAENQVNYLILKYRSQVSIKNLKIKTLERKLKLLLAHLQPIQEPITPKMEQTTDKVLDNRDQHKNQSDIAIEQQQRNTPSSPISRKQQLEHSDQTQQYQNGIRHQSKQALQKIGARYKQNDEVVQVKNEEDQYVLNQQAHRLYDRISLLENQIADLKMEVEEYQNGIDQQQAFYQNKICHLQTQLDHQRQSNQRNHQQIQQITVQNQSNHSLIQQISHFLLSNFPFQFQKNGDPLRKPKSTKANQNQIQQQSNQNMIKSDNVNIMQTLKTFFEDYQEQSKQYVEMEEYIEQLKGKFQFKQQFDERVLVPQNNKIKEGQKVIEELRKQVRKLQQKCKYLQEEVAGYQSKFASMEASQAKELSQCSQSYHYNPKSTHILHENSIIGSKHNEDGNEQILEKISFGDQELDDESISYSDKDLRNMKAIYQAAQTTLQQNSKLKGENKKLGELINNIQRQLQIKNAQITKIEQYIKQNMVSRSQYKYNNEEDPSPVTKKQQSDSQFIQNNKQIQKDQLDIDSLHGESQVQEEKELIEQIQQLIQQKAVQYQISANQREQQFLLMLSRQLDQIFSSTIFKGQQIFTLHDRICKIKEIFANRPQFNADIHTQLSSIELLLKQNEELLDEEIELHEEKVHNFHQNRKQIDLTQSKLYLNELEVIIRKLQNKNEQDKDNYIRQKQQHTQIQAGLMSQIRDLAFSNRAHKKMIEELSNKLGLVQDIDEIQAIMDSITNYMIQVQRQPYQWGQQSISTHRNDINEEEMNKKMLIRVNLMEEMRKKYFPKPSEFIDLLIEKIILLTATSTQDQLMDGFQAIFQVLKQNEEKNNKQRQKRQQSVKQKASYIDELCKRGNEPGFGEDMNESKMGMKSSRNERSRTKMSRVFDSAMKASRHFQ